MESGARFELSCSSQMITVSKYDFSKYVREHMIWHNDKPIIEFKNAFLLSEFDELISELAEKIAWEHPCLDFHATAWLDDTEEMYVINFLITYENGLLIIKRTGTCYMFRDEQICLECGADLSEVFNEKQFECPECGALYVESSEDYDFDEVDHVFGGDDEEVTEIRIREVESKK